MVAKFVYTILYHLVHRLLDLVCKLQQVVNSVKKLRWSWPDGNPCYDLNIKTRKLNRIPKHIGILLAEESISFIDISNIIVWCVAMGITFISLYDHDGVLKKKKHILQEHLQEMKSRFFGKSIKFTSEFEVDFDAISINGITNNHSLITKEIRINIFSHTDGQHHLAKVAADICQSVKSGTIKPCDIEVNTVSQYVNNGIINGPDPDLVLQFGDVYSILGFLPWNIRLTEILLLSSHHNVAYDEFYKMLLRFSACEQRCGQ